MHGSLETRCPKNAKPKNFEPHLATWFHLVGAFKIFQLFPIFPFSHPKQPPFPCFLPPAATNPSVIRCFLLPAWLKKAQRHRRFLGSAQRRPAMVLHFALRRAASASAATVLRVPKMPSSLLQATGKAAVKLKIKFMYIYNCIYILYKSNTYTYLQICTTVCM